MQRVSSLTFFRAAEHSSLTKTTHGAAPRRAAPLTESLRRMEQTRMMTWYFALKSA